MLHAHRRSVRFFALFVPLVLVLSACGGDKPGSSDAAGEEEEVGDPVRGGSVTYGLEAETGDGW
ncbi:MAG TPA: ABC transporter substrate-binding protein, partial [Iamia sp.]|nr:ABC transporter substrate-binding protein [Iamia sp.]